MGKAIQFKDSENKKIYVCPYFPVGSIYLSVVNTNPTKWFGGTWEQIAKGRTLVGVDTSQTEFKTVKKTGGEKTHKLTVNEIPSHKHRVTSYKGNGSIEDGYNARMGNGVWENNIYTTAIGGDQPHNNLQPYFTCYIWCRTA